MRYRKKQTRRGAALVELALVLPIFFMVILGTIEFGRALMTGQQLTGAVRMVARLASLDGSTNLQVQTEVTNFCKSVLGQTTDVTVLITIIPAPGNPDPLNNLSLATSGDLCKVNVTVPFNSVSLLRANYLADKSMHVSASLPHE